MPGPIPADSDRPLFGVPIAVFDFETTWEGDEPANPGARASDFHLREHYAVEVAVAHARLGVPESVELAYSTTIKPPIQIREEASAIHGLDDDAVSDSPAFHEIRDDLLAALSDRVLVAFNLPFDWRVLTAECNRSGRGAPGFGGLDPLVWARVVHRYERGKRLCDEARRYGVVFWPHEAGNDVKATARIMPFLLRDLVRNDHVDERHLRSVRSACDMTARLAREWETDLTDYHRRRQSPPPYCYWRELTGERAS